MAQLTVTCHTPGCMNAGAAIVLAYDPDDGPPGAVVCGPCGQPIDDITDQPDDQPDDQRAGS